MTVDPVIIAINANELLVFYIERKKLKRKKVDN